MKIFSDPVYQECLRLAQNCKSDIRFGSVVMKDGRVIGRGWNRLVKDTDVPIRMGYCNHGEVNAMNDAINRGHNITGAIVYVAGYYKDGSLYIPHGVHFSCNRCPNYFLKYGIEGVRIPNESGWKFLSTLAAKECGNNFFRTKESRINIGKRDILIQSVLQKGM